MAKCSVCPNKHGETNRTISYFKFPKNPERRKKWVQFVRQIRQNQAWETVPSSVICSKHFIASDFIRSHLQGLLHLKIRNVLTLQAVPTIAIESSNEQSTPEVDPIPILLTQASSVDAAGDDSAMDMDPSTISSEGDHCYTQRLYETHFVKLENPDEAQTSYDDPLTPNPTSAVSIKQYQYDICALISEVASRKLELATSKKDAANQEQVLRKRIALIESDHKKELAKLRKDMAKMVKELNDAETHKKNMRFYITEHEEKLKLAKKEIRKLKLLVERGKTESSKFQLQLVNRAIIEDSSSSDEQ